MAGIRKDVSLTDVEASGYDAQAYNYVEWLDIQEGEILYDSNVDEQKILNHTDDEESQDSDEKNIENFDEIDNAQWFETEKKDNRNNSDGYVLNIDEWLDLDIEDWVPKNIIYYL